MSVDIGGLISIIVFYVVILIIGIWASRKTGFRTNDVTVDDVMLANRSLGLFVGSFTMTATWVGGGYINGTAEIVASGGGLVWCQAPLGYAISLFFGGLFFVDKMRKSNFTTMLDPFQLKYGDLMNCLLYIPALSGDIFWSGAILAALGASLKVTLDLNLQTAIITSAAIACLYTLLGGLYSVAYTDVVQLFCIFIGLWLCLPFAFTHHSVQPISNTSKVWRGEITPPYIAEYIDSGLLLICGGIPWQVYWQRVLSARSTKVARWLSYVGALGCVVMAIPPATMGVVAASTDWNKTGYGLPEISVEDKTLVLPLVMRHLCPPAITFIGLGAVSAAVMSSTDSAVLSSSCMFARNVFAVIYARIFKVTVSDSTQILVMRVSQIVITTISCVMAFSVNSIYALWILCSDWVYVTLFPQLVCVLYLSRTNSYGSFAAFFAGFCVRMLGGERSLDIDAVIRYPWYDEEHDRQLFPHRTFSMLISLFTLISVSYSAEFLFTRGVIPLSMDFYGCFKNVLHEQLNNAPTSNHMSLMPSNDSATTRRRTLDAEQTTTENAHSFTTEL